MGFSQAPALPYSKLGIVEDGDMASQSIEKDKYIIWKGGNYFAKTDIQQGETFVVDTNLTAVTEGAINGIVEAIGASLQWKLIGITTGTTAVTIPSGYNELFIIGWCSNSTSIGQGVYVYCTGILPTIILDDTTHNYSLSGGYQGGSNGKCYYVYASKTRIQPYYVRDDSSEVTNRYLAVYGR